MTADTRHAALAAALRAATANMRANGNVVPMIIAHVPDGTIRAFTLGDVMGSELRKELAQAMIGAEMRRLKATQYVFMSEGWQARTHPGDPQAGKLPSERPDRIEVLILTASDHEGETLATYELIRDRRGRFKDFELLTDTDLDELLSAEGKFLGLLRKPTTH